MTLEQINALTLDDVLDQVKSRVFNSLDPQPVFDEETDGDFLEWYDSLFTQEQLDAEFLVYKQELLDAENERLRKIDLKSRFESLEDMRLAFHTLHPDKPNPAIWLKELLANEDHADAEAQMVALENKDIELRPSAEDVKKKNIREARRKEIDLEEVIEAVLENDNAKLAQLRTNFAQIKGRFE